MKPKTLTTIFAIILLVGIVTATGTITNLSPSLEIPSFIAGGTTNTTFSFDYEDKFENNPDASLVLRANISSLKEDFPVWKEDFQLNGFIEQSPLFGIPFLEKTIPLKCVENTAEFRVRQGILHTETNIPNGTFYCYDPNNYIDMLELGRKDKVNLFISSDPALFPGTYNVSVELMEMEPDFEGPIIELIEPSENQIFSENDTILIKLNITDMYNIDSSSVRYKIVSLGIPAEGVGLNITYYDSGWITDISFNENSMLYEGDFNITERGLNNSGEYWIYAEAKDVLGNKGNL